MRKVFYVSPHGNQWRVHREKQIKGKLFSSKTMAILYARTMTSQLSEGHISQIIVKKQDGTFQTEWTYGKDPYPPAG